MLPPTHAPESRCRSGGCLTSTLPPKELICRLQPMRQSRDAEVALASLALPPHQARLMAPPSSLGGSAAQSV
jgi:hypothetical protein